VLRLERMPAGSDQALMAYWVPLDGVALLAAVEPWWLQALTGRLAVASSVAPALTLARAPS
jgi:hypothetical protein